MIGYFDNAITDDYIKCTSNGTDVTCSKLDSPSENDKTCKKAGNLLYVDGTKVKLCLDTTTENAIEIFKNERDRYFMQSKILNTPLSDNKYYLISISENAVLPVKGKLNKINECKKRKRVYKYKKDFKIIYIYLYIS